MLRRQLGLNFNEMADCEIKFGVRIYHFDYANRRFKRLGNAVSDPFWIVMENEDHFKISGIFLGDERINVKPIDERFGPLSNLR